MKKIFTFAIMTLLLAACGNSNSNDSSLIAGGLPEPSLMNYTVTNILPHDTSYFTEGFEIHNCILYESAGDPDYIGVSRLVKTDLKTGKEIQKISLTKEFFAEGLTVLHGKIYQLTWKEHKCFVYDSATLKKLNEFTYEGEGWGMTNDGKNLIMDNGNNNLYYRDPETFKIVQTIGVIDNNGGVSNLNELEYVDGFIYSNIWMKDWILKIDPNTGHVVSKADIGGLKEKSFQGPFLDKADVLNGIAYDKESRKFYITGKYWSKIFEIKFN